MKLCLLSLLLISMICQAAPHHRYYRTHKTPSKIATQIETVNKLNRKPVVAGGVAGGTLIAAYKISDGIQEGTKNVAKEHPCEFNSWVSVLTMPLRYTMGILLLVLLIVAVPRLIPYLQKNNPKRKEKYEN